MIEPYLTDQWYVDVKPLAERALAAVRDGRTRFVPENWEKTYFQWLDNIEPWCVSRQLWWGHQIPAWYAPDGTLFVAETEEEALAEALAHAVKRDDGREARALADAPSARPHPRPRRARHLVLLRPLAVFDARLARRDAGTDALLPTSVLVTGFDIIFFWVARMMMMGLHFLDEVPFRDVYIHALVRDEKGAKMSKSKGNIIDPLELDRPVRRRRAALYARRHGGAGARHQAVDPARRRLPQLRDQDLERRPLRRDERLRPRRRLRPEGGAGNAEPLGFGRMRQDDRRGHGGDRVLPLQRSGGRGLPLRLERVLRLASRTRETRAPRRGRAGEG